MAGRKVLERGHVSPPLSAPGGSTRLPLTYLDLPWLFFHPSQRLFFYDYPHPASRFASAALPLLKSSLSLALRLFYPLAGHLHDAPARRPTIACPPSSAGVSFTVAESDDDFHDLTYNDTQCPRQRAASRFHPLVPGLASGEGHSAPLMTVQITVFPRSGFSVGIAYRHVAADERTFNNFIKAWASFCSRALTGKGECRPAPTPLIDPPHFDRAVIRDMPALEQRFLHEWWKHQHLHQQQQQLQYSIPLAGGNPARSIALDDTAVWSTFVICPAQMDLVRSWIAGHCTANGLPLPVHLSPYVLACALLWVARVGTYVRLLPGTGQKDSVDDRTSYFGFIAGGITRVGYPVPGSYFGNCVGFGRAEATCGELLGKAGIYHAAVALGGTIKRLDRSMLDGAEGWIMDWRAMSESDLHVIISGSPKVDFYETDFGWGRPRKVEEVSIDWSGAISLHESRDVEGAMEVGLSLPKVKMDTFSSLLSEGIRSLNR